MSEMSYRCSSLYSLQESGGEYYVVNYQVLSIAEASLL